MTELEAHTWVTIATIVTTGISIMFGTMAPALAEGRAVVAALEAMGRQPESARDIRTTLLIAMALLESTAIYVLLVLLVLIFANPLLDRFFAAGM
jgi:F-type H+-transporting ATPase subunit c